MTKARLQTSTIAATLLAAVLLAAPAASRIDPFYAQRLQDGLRAYDRGDHQRAREELRIAAFGLLESPIELTRALTHLALAQSATDDREAFEQTYGRLVDLEDRFEAYSAATLTAEMRAALDQAAAPLPPLAPLASAVDADEPTEQMAESMSQVETDAPQVLESDDLAAQRIAELRAEVSDWRTQAVEADRKATALQSEVSTLSEQVDELTAELAPSGEQAKEPASRAADPAALETLVEDWARAWSEQRVDDYLGFYSSAFKPSSGATRSAWADLRRQRLTAPSFVEVRLSEIDTHTDNATRASVRFLQSYRSDTFSDTVRKVLGFALEDGGWKISEEITVPTAQPVRVPSDLTDDEQPERRTAKPRTQQRREAMGRAPVDGEESDEIPGE